MIAQANTIIPPDGVGLPSKRVGSSYIVPPIMTVNKLSFSP